MPEFDILKGAGWHASVLPNGFINRPKTVANSDDPERAAELLHGDGSVMMRDVPVPVLTINFPLIDLTFENGPIRQIPSRSANLTPCCLRQGRAGGRCRVYGSASQAARSLQADAAGCDGREKRREST